MEILKTPQDKILVIQTAFIGDAALTLPMIQKLNELFPESIIDVVATPVSAELFKSSPFVNRVYSYDKKKKEKSFLSLFKFGLQLKHEKYTRIYSPHRSLRTGLLVWFSGVKDTFGFSNTALKFAYKTLIEYIPGDHEVKRNLSLIGYAGDWHVYPVIKPDDIVETKIKSIISVLPKHGRFAAVAPGSVWETKKFPVERYIGIINFLIKNSYHVLLIGGEADKSLCEEIASGFKNNVFSFAGRLSVVESIELLRRCDILISNDSAPTHFGMCADIPVLTIYCSTIPGFGFYPYNSKSRFLSFDELKCKPCGIHGLMKCPENTFACAYNLEASSIEGKILEMTGKND